MGDPIFTKQHVPLQIGILTTWEKTLLQDSDSSCTMDSDTSPIHASQENTTAGAGNLQLSK